MRQCKHFGPVFRPVASGHRRRIQSHRRLLQDEEEIAKRDAQFIVGLQAGRMQALADRDTTPTGSKPSPGSAADRTTRNDFSATNRRKPD